MFWRNKGTIIAPPFWKYWFNFIFPFRVFIHVYLVNMKPENSRIVDVKVFHSPKHFSPSFVSVSEGVFFLSPSPLVSEIGKFIGFGWNFTPYHLLSANVCTKNYEIWWKNTVNCFIFASTNFHQTAKKAISLVRKFVISRLPEFYFLL